MRLGRPLGRVADTPSARHLGRSQTDVLQRARMGRKPAVAAPPFQLEVVSQTLVKPLKASPQEGRTELSCFDATIVATAIGRALGFPGARIDAAALESALAVMLADLPFLAGRLGRMTGLRLGSLHIAHTGEGAEFSVVEAEGVSIAAMGADHWPQEGITVAAPQVPFYLEPMDVGRRLLAGKEPLLKVRLTRLEGGDVLGVTMCHAIADGTRWPAFAAHLAARYRQFAAGVAAYPSDLLRPCDRRQLSSTAMAKQLLGADGASWQPAKLPPVRGSLVGYWRLARLLLSNSRQRQDLLVLHLPEEQVAALKQLAAEGNPGEAISTGDAVQAAAALLVHAASKKPLLPESPKGLAVVAQVPAPPAYFGNGGRLLRVTLPGGTPQPAAGDFSGALQQLAGAIRCAVTAFRTQPAEALEAIQDCEALAAAPAPRMLAYLAARRMPLLTCTTNYVPAQQAPDFGLGWPAAYDRELTFPLARDMAVIRPAVPPLSGGLLVQLCLAPKAAARLRRSDLLEQLLPQARFVGGLAP